MWRQRLTLKVVFWGHTALSVKSSYLSHTSLPKIAGRQQCEASSNAWHVFESCGSSIAFGWIFLCSLALFIRPQIRLLPKNASSLVKWGVFLVTLKIEYYCFAPNKLKWVKSYKSSTRKAYLQLAKRYLGFFVCRVTVRKPLLIPKEENRRHGNLSLQRSSWAL